MAYVHCYIFSAYPRINLICSLTFLLVLSVRPGPACVDNLSPNLIPPFSHKPTPIIVRAGGGVHQATLHSGFLALGERGGVQVRGGGGVTAAAARPSGVRATHSAASSAVAKVPRLTSLWPRLTFAW